MPVSPQRTKPKTQSEAGSVSVRRAAEIPYAVHVMGVLPADIVDRISEAHAVAVAHLVEHQQNNRASISLSGLK